MTLVMLDPEDSIVGRALADTEEEVAEFRAKMRAKHAILKGIPDRCGPARVAYDDSMGLGQMIVAEAHGDTGQ